MEDKNFLLYKILRKERLDLIKLTCAIHDKYLLGISAAMIAFSSSFVKIKELNQCLYVLYFSWIFLIISLFFILLTFHLSYKFHIDSMKLEEKLYLRNSRNIYFENNQENSFKDNQRCTKKIIYIFRWTADGAFIISLILFLIFVGLNV